MLSHPWFSKVIFQLYVFTCLKSKANKTKTHWNLTIQWCWMNPSRFKTTEISAPRSVACGKGGASATTTARTAAKGSPDRAWNKNHTVSIPQETAGKPAHVLFHLAILNPWAPIMQCFDCIATVSLHTSWSKACWASKPSHAGGVTSKLRNKTN